MLWPTSGGDCLNITNLKLIFLLVVGTYFVSGCGFHLRGQGESLGISQLKGLEVYLAVTSEDNLLRRQIANDLQASGMTVVNEPESSPNHLIVLNSKVLRRAIGVDSNGRNNEFELNQRVRFLVNYVNLETQTSPPNRTKSSKKNPTEEVMQVEVRRSFYLDNIDLIGKRAEEKGLLDSIRQEVSRKIVSRFVVSLDRQLNLKSKS